MNTEIDFVIAWVDGTDENWIREKDAYKPNVLTEDDSAVRYRDWKNLKYWFRSVEKYTPWVRKIHFVTWGHIPAWLDTTNPKLHVVKHTDYIPKEYLPTFNSHTIELNLHRIHGLSEQFVYFNDDMFVNRPMQPQQFFQKGLPCDVFGLDCVYFGIDSAGPYIGNDLTVINKHFRKSVSLKKNFGKYFRLRYGARRLYNTFFLTPWRWFPGFVYQHVANGYLKSTFEKVWEAEPEMLDETCKSRFRSQTNVNQWVFKFWQLAEGNFYPRAYKLSRCYHLSADRYCAELIDDIRHHTHGLICINDVQRTTDFEGKRDAINAVFEEVFPTPSSYEK